MGALASSKRRLALASDAQRIGFVLAAALLFEFMSFTTFDLRILLAFAFFCGLPLVAYLFLVQTKVGSVVAGLGLGVVIVLTNQDFQDAVDSDSSTSVLAWFGFTMTGTSLVIGVAVLEVIALAVVRVVRRRLSSARETPVGAY